MKTLGRDHFEEVAEAHATLCDHFAYDPSICVAAGKLVYFDQDDFGQVVDPDVFVVRGIAPARAPLHRDGSYRTWENGGLRPGFALEVTSNRYRRRMSLMDDPQVGVAELFLFDPSHDSVDTAVRGYRLRQLEYAPIEPTPGARVLSEQLGLELAAEGRHLRFYEPGATTPLPTRSEKVEQATVRAEQAEAELRGLRAELERLRGGGGGG